MQLSDYETPERFRARVLALTEAAVAGLDDAPKLIAFPETIGFPLLLTLGNVEVSSAKTFGEAALLLAKRHWRALLRVIITKRLSPAAALYHLRALPAYSAYRDAFAEAARFAKATVVAGTVFSPHIEEEASRGVHVAGRGVHNTAFTFGPTGRILDRTHKVYLTPGAESRAGLTRAPLEHVHAFETPVGRVGVAVCLDGFYGSVLERLDGLGAQIVVQPSANHAPWERPWPPDPALTEGEAWLRYGLREGLQNRLHLRYGVNPMMVGEVLDLAPRGRSSLVANTRYHPTEEGGLEGVLALSKSADSEETVRAVVDIEG